MTEKSMLWAAPTSGDGTAAYTEAETTRLFRYLVGGDPANEGVLKLVDNGLEVTGTSSPLAVNTGAALVYGYFYWNTASVNVAVSTPVVGTTGHRVVLQLSDSAQTVRIALISSADGISAYPALTQSAGVTWEIPLANLTITTGGVITVVDARGYCHFATMIDEDRLDASIAGNGLTGGDGSALAVNVDNSTLEINTDIVRIKDAGVTSAKINTAVAGNGLTGGGGSALAVNPDNSTIEISSDQVRIKDAGVTSAKINTAVAGNGLTGGGGSALAVNVDNSTVEISSDQVRVKDGGITAAKIANRTRQFMVFSHTDDGNSNLYRGCEAPDGVTTNFNGVFVVPEDFASGLEVDIIWDAGATGNMRLTMQAASPAVGETFSTNGQSWGTSTVAFTSGILKNGHTMTFSSSAKGDIVGLHTSRQGGDALDTIGTFCYFHGFLVRYTADS